MKMYTLIRKFHLFLGLILVTFVLMYFVTAVIFMHHKWFDNHPPKRTVDVYELTYSGDVQSYSIYLQNKFNLSGKRVEIRWPGGQDFVRQFPNGRLRCVYVRPGWQYEAVVSPERDKVTITTQEAGFKQTLLMMHRLAGYGGGWLYSVWALIVDLVSLSMIVFSITGIYMWYKLTKKHLLGWLILAGNYGLAVATILYLLYAP